MRAITPPSIMLTYVLHSHCEAVICSCRMEELQRAGWRALSPRTAPASWRGRGFWSPQAQEGVKPRFPTSRVKALTKDLLNTAEESSKCCHCTLQRSSSLCYGNVHQLYPLGKTDAPAGSLSSWIWQCWAVSYPDAMTQPAFLDMPTAEFQESGEF